LDREAVDGPTLVSARRSATSRSGATPVQLAGRGPGCPSPWPTAEAMARTASPDTWVGLDCFALSFFLCGPRGQEEVVVSRNSRRRPHDTGLVTLRGRTSRVRPATCGLCWGCRSPAISLPRRGRSRVILAPGNSPSVAYGGRFAAALGEPDTPALLLFGKPESSAPATDGRWVVARVAKILAEARGRPIGPPARVNVVGRKPQQAGLNRD